MCTIVDMWRLLCVTLLATVITCAPTVENGEPKGPQLYADETLLTSDFVTSPPNANSTEISVLKGWVYNNQTGLREKRTLFRRGCNTCGGGGGYAIPVVIYKTYTPARSGCHGCYSGCRGGCGGGGGGGGSYSYSQSSSSAFSWGKK